MFDESPFALMRRMQQDINRVFADAGTPLTQQDLASAIWSPPIEVSYRDGKLTVSTELPGLTEKDVRVDIDNGYLVIQGERKDEREEDQGGVRRTERHYGRFYRAIALPDGADTDNVQAVFQNGMLNVAIPVAQENTRQVPIQKSESSTGQTQQQQEKQPEPAGKAA